MPSNLDNILLIKINGEIKHALECTWDHSPRETGQSPITCRVIMMRHMSLCRGVRIWISSFDALFQGYLFLNFVFLIWYNFLKTCILEKNLKSQITCSSGAANLHLKGKLKTLRGATGMRKLVSLGQFCLPPAG